MLTANNPTEDRRKIILTSLSAYDIGHHPLASYQKKAYPKWVSIPTKETLELALVCPETVLISSFSFEFEPVCDTIVRLISSCFNGVVDSAARSLCLLVG